MSIDDEKDGAECAGEEFAAEVMNFCASRVPCTMSYLKDPPAVTAEIMLTGNRAPVVRTTGVGVPLLRRS